MRQLTDKVRFEDKVSVKGFDIILVQAGTNDLSNIVKQNLLWCTDLQDVLDRYVALNTMIRRRNKHAVLLFSAVLPRLNDFGIYAPLAYGLNFALSKWCAKSGGRRVFVDSAKLFMLNGRPRATAFSQSDGLHLNGFGTDLLEGCYQQVMTYQYIKEQNESKRVKMLASL